jgi:membrane protein YdbS with pleckstrin-like domain
MEQLQDSKHQSTMKKTYKSKIGLELLLPVVLVLGTVLLLSLTEEPAWAGVAILMPVILFVMHLFLTTNYTIEGDQLLIKSGFLFRKTVPIPSIRKINETNNPLSAPATSLDRLEIVFGKYESVLISPKQKLEFIQHIQSINPAVELRMKRRDT